MKRRPVLTRLMEKVDPSSGCWIWTGGRTETGYGVMFVDPRVRRTHRIAYELFVGPVPEGLELDHLCRNRACCNPSHLEPVTHAENTRRGNSGKFQRSKTHCPKGHPYSGENLYVHGSGRRMCRQCRYAANALRQSTPEFKAKRNAQRRVDREDD